MRRGATDAEHQGGGAQQAAAAGARPRGRAMEEDASPRALAALAIIENAPAMERTMDPLRTLFDVKHVSYVGARYGHEPHKDPYVLSTYPPLWLARYLFKRYWRLDPVVREGFRRTEPFDWSEIDRDTPELAAFFEDAARFGVGQQGFLIPLRNASGQRGILSVTGDAVAGEWRAQTKAMRADLMETGHVLHHTALREMFGDEAPPPRLSPREKEALRWVAEGKEVPDIAIITGLSEHTVRTYLKSARLKLDCGTKTQAAVKAERLALLSSDEP